MNTQSNVVPIGRKVELSDMTGRRATVRVTEEALAATVGEIAPLLAEKLGLPARSTETGAEIAYQLRADDEGRLVAGSELFGDLLRDGAPRFTIAPDVQAGGAA